MTLERLRPYTTAVVEPAVTIARRLGLGPDGVSVIGFLTAVTAAGAFVLGSTTSIAYLMGAVLVALSGWLDLVDGALARELAAQSASGDVLDHTMDRYADVVLVGGLAFGTDQLALGFLAVSGVLLTSYLGTQAQAVGYGRLYAGLVGRSDRLVAIALGAGVMAITETTVANLTAVGWVLVFLGVVGHLTAVQRFVVLWRNVE